MEAKLYVGNLPYTTVDADLQNLFSQAGTVKSAQVIRDRASGRSKGFGFVEMSSSEEAQSAITMFHGKDFSGRPLTVNLARPREDRPGGGGVVVFAIAAVDADPAETATANADANTKSLSDYLSF